MGKRAELFLPSSARENVLPTTVSGEVLLASASHLLRDPLLLPLSSLIPAFPQYRHFMLDGTLILSSLVLGFPAVGAVSSLPHPSLAPGSPAQLGPDLLLWPERCWDVPSTCHRKRNKDTEHMESNGLGTTVINPLKPIQECCCARKGLGCEDGLQGDNPGVCPAGEADTPADLCSNEMVQQLLQL